MGYKKIIFIMFFLTIFGYVSASAYFQGYHKLKVIRFKGCQYIENETTHYHKVLTHLGNCDNLIHKCDCGEKEITAP